MPITLKDIAQELNISVNAVSRALRNMPDIGPQTTKLVQETAQRMGYRKNLAASYLKTTRSMMLGIIIPDICNPVFSYLYKGIESVCNAEHYTLLLGNTDEDPAREKHLIDHMIARGVDGILIVPRMNGEVLSEAVAQSKLPFAVIQRKIAGANVNFVQSNDYEGGYLAAKHLYLAGHRRFLLLFASMQISSAYERYHGFFAYLQEMGLSSEAVQLLECDGTKTSGYTVLKNWLGEHPKKDFPHAIFCFSDYIAYGAYAALNEYGIQIGHDISVLGYDNNEYSEMISPALSTIDMLPRELGEHAAHLILEQIESSIGEVQSNPPQTLVISPRLIVRDSVKERK